MRHAILVAGMLGAIGIAVTAQRFVVPQRLYSIEETEQLVKADVAAIAKVNVNDIHVVARAERTWSDNGLGCGPSAGAGSAAVDGYAFTLKSARGHFEYHTNQSGDLQRCRVVRPIAP